MPLLPPLVSPEELRDAIGDERVRVFDATVFLRRAVDGGPYTVESGRKSYARAHIPAAGFADIPGALSDPASPFAFTLPAAAQFAAAIGRLGIGDGTHVVAYAQDAPMWATRLWWLERLLAGYVVLYALQAAYSPDFTTALQQVVFFYVPFALAYCLLRRLDWTQRLTRTCLALLAGLAVLFALVGFVEYETKTIFLNPKLIAANQLHAYFTVNSVFFDPNIFGRFLALVMILLAAVILYARRRRTVLITGAVLAILWVALLLTLSRSSIGALLVGLGTLAAVRWRVGRAVFIAAGVVAVVVAVIAITPTTFGSTRDSTAPRAAVRVSSPGASICSSNDRSGATDRGRSRPEFAARHHAIGETTSASHTIPVTIAAEQGLIGVLVYLGLVLAALFVLFRRCRSDPARVAIAAAFLALLFHTLLYADFLEDPITWTLLAIGSALAARPPSDSGGRGSELAAGERQLQQQLA